MQANAAYCGLAGAAGLRRREREGARARSTSKGSLSAACRRRSRPVFTRRRRVRGLGPAEALAAVEAAVAARDCRDAVVRLRLDGLARDVYQALDLRRIAALLADALHFVLAVGPAGLSAGAEASRRGASTSRPSRGHACPRAWTPTRVVTLARGFLRRRRRRGGRGGVRLETLALREWRVFDALDLEFSDGLIGVRGQNGVGQDDAGRGDRVGAVRQAARAGAGRRPAAPGRCRTARARASR